MNIFVTGGTGFLGQHLCAALRGQGHEVIAVSSKDCDLTRSTSLEAFAHHRFDQILHLAAWTQAGDFCLHHQGEQWIHNQLINSHLLAWWHKRQPQAKLIAMGTSCSYPCDAELTEDNYLTGQPIGDLYTYAMTKRMLLVGLRSLHRQFGMEYLCLVPSTLYGPGYHLDGRQMHFIFDLIRKILAGKLFGDAVTLWGDGHQRRELIYIDDFVADTLRLSQDYANELINIGGGAEYTIRQFAAMICEIVGFPFGQIRFDTSKYVGAKSKCLKIDKLDRLLPQRNVTPLREGLEKTIGWLLANKESVFGRAKLSRAG